MQEHNALPDFNDVRAAAGRIADRVSRTPVRNFPALDELLGCELWLKCEHHQATGAFKLRGASNALAVLREQGRSGDVATHSSGNHGAALAWVAREEGRRAFVVMPDNAVTAKVDAVRRFGGEVVFCEAGQVPREAGLARQVELGRIPVPSYDHRDIICGQGTAALELFGQLDGLDALVTPVGGGGLLAGSALAATGLAPGIALYGAEPAGAADTAASMARGQRVASWSPDTVADGLRAVIGKMNFALIEKHVTAILLADDAAMERAMRVLLEHAGERLEPSAAIAVAVIQNNPERFAGKRVGVILTGGNIDFQRYPWMAPAPADRVNTPA